MRVLGGFTIALLLGGSAFAQYHGTFSGVQPVVKGGFPSVVFPAGTPATNPGIQRINPNVVYPGGGGPHLVIPGANNGAQHRSTAGVFLYPVYVGAYGSSYDYQQQQEQPPQQGAPNVTIIMPPQQPPVVINQYDAPPPRPQMNVYQPEDTAPEQTRYLLAFKDHTIYSAVAYWIDGDTLHYFTAGNTHNQVSVSLIDRPMTERLNKDSGVEVKLPALK